MQSNIELISAADHAEVMTTNEETTALDCIGWFREALKAPGFEHVDVFDEFGRLQARFTGHTPAVALFDFFEAL